MEITQAEIRQMLESRECIVRQSTPKGYKTITFTGTKQELSLLGDALKKLDCP